MNDNIYVLYDNNIENEDSLLKFSKILIAAKFEASKIMYVTLDEYISHIESTNSFYPFVIAINQTYKTINQIYSNRLNVPIFDFFSREFSNQNLVLYGLLFSVSSLYEPAYKKFAWSFVQKFYSKVIDFEINSDQKISCDYLSDQVAEEVVQETSIKEEPQEIIEEVILKVEPTETFVEENSTENITYSALLEYYNNTKHFLDLFSTIQKETKRIELLLDEKI